MDKQKFFCHRLLDENGDLLGFRADSLGSLKQDWGKVFSTESTARRVLDFAHKSSHSVVANALKGVNNPASALIFAGSNSGSLEKTKTVELLELTGFDGFNVDAYTSESFAKLVKTAKVIETKIIQ